MVSEELDRVRILVEYLRVLANLKNADHFVNNEISRVIQAIEKEMKLEK